MSTSRRLSVWNNSTLVGYLSEESNIWSFEYSPQWAGFDLSPSLPFSRGPIIDGSTRRPVQWFFDNLLPEEAARTLLAKSVKLDSADSFGLLMQFGAESAGALTLLANGETPDAGTAVSLDYSEISDRIRELPRTPLARHKRMSLAGAQHKMPILKVDGHLYEPSSAQPSSHILKPNHTNPEHYWDTVVNEFSMMQIARACNLPVPSTEVLRVPEPVYLIERFDRTASPNGLVREHVIDALQLLSLDRSFKYVSCTPETLSALRERVSKPAQTSLALFRWFIFNLLIGNGDNHLKNLSFKTAGSRPTLAPFYDLVSTALYEPDNRWLEAELSWSINGVNQFGSVDMAYVQALAEPLKISPRLIRATIFELVARVSEAADKVILDLESAEYNGLSKQSELRTLRSFKHGVLSDMSAILNGITDAL